ncbi:hypothetical protein GCM10023192_54860 [Amycolatopsis samaneae]
MVGKDFRPPRHRATREQSHRKAGSRKENTGLITQRCRLWTPVAGLSLQTNTFEGQQRAAKAPTPDYGGSPDPGCTVRLGFPAVMRPNVAFGASNAPNATLGRSTGGQSTDLRQ